MLGDGGREFLVLSQSPMTLRHPTLILGRASLVDFGVGPMEIHNLRLSRSQT